jgi:hypothetical protein
MLAVDLPSLLRLLEFLASGSPFNEPLRLLDQSSTETN